MTQRGVNTYMGKKIRCDNCGYDLFDYELPFDRLICQRCLFTYNSVHMAAQIQHVANCPKCSDNSIQYVLDWRPEFSFYYCHKCHTTFAEKEITLGRHRTAPAQAPNHPAGVPGRSPGPRAEAKPSIGASLTVRLPSNFTVQGSPARQSGKSWLTKEFIEDYKRLFYSKNVLLQSHTKSVPPPSLPLSPLEVGEIIAWRVWKIWEPGVLVSLSAKFVWMPGQIVEGNPEAESRGIFATKTEVEARIWWQHNGGAMSWSGDSGAPWALGQVKLWGTVVEHEKGFRAQFAKVHRIEASYYNDLKNENDQVLSRLRTLYTPDTKY